MSEMELPGWDRKDKIQRGVMDVVEKGRSHRKRKNELRITV